MKLAPSKMPHCGTAASQGQTSSGKMCWSQISGTLVGSETQAEKPGLRERADNSKQGMRGPLYTSTGPALWQGHLPSLLLRAPLNSPAPHSTPTSHHQDRRETSASRNLLRSSAFSSITEVMKEKHLVRWRSRAEGEGAVGKTSQGVDLPLPSHPRWDPPSSTFQNVLGSLVAWKILNSEVVLLCI